MSLKCIVVEIDPTKLPTHKQLFEEATADLVDTQSVLINMWRKYKDPEIAAHFKSRGGVMIDGVYMFGKNS